MKKKPFTLIKTAMRLTNNLFVFVFLFTGLMLFDGTLYAQNSKRLDSIIKVTTLKMYISPDEVIATGKKVVNEAGNDIDMKIRAYKLIADGYSSKRDYQKSLEYVNKAMQILPQSNNELLKINILNKAAVQYHQLKAYDKAIQYLDQVEKMCLAYPTRDSVRNTLGVNYIVRGFIYKEKLNCDIAINFFDRGINEMLKSKKPSANISGLSIAIYNKGNCYLTMSKNALAISSFQESIAYAKKINANSLQAFAQKGLAQVYTLEGKYNEAIAILQEAHKISSDVNDLVLNQEIYKGLSENYLAINQWDNYKKYRLEYLKAQGKLMESERKSISDSLKDIEKEEGEKFESYTSNFFSGFVIAALSLISVIILFILSIRKSKQSIENLQKVVKNLQNEKPSNDAE
ncbi:tetratricopeptide repeat protein [Flavobacterium sp.]|uniref:tetratricopeptide repeat protein n=1 Tax=Flavobacterium sp. TaxID=239 RepID=UPI00261F30E7|nr:tetratricopeptide repeat protein [Flavobacterium sp.]